MRETWFILENGLPADPALCALDEGGVMRHSESGVAVAMRGNALSSRGMDPQEIEAARGEPMKGRELKPEKPGKGYKTKEARAES